MKVAKWGNSLAVRLPAKMVEGLGLSAGDEIEMTVRADGAIEVAMNERRRQALEQVRKLRFKLPPGYKFDREEANARGRYETAEEPKPGAAAD